MLALSLLMRFAGSLLVLACLAVPTRAVAATITFIFDCEVTPQSPGAVCVPGGSYGSLTLTDSSVDPNRVDVSGSFTPSFGATLERILLNWNGTVPTNTKLYYVPTNAPVGVASNTPFPTIIGTSTAPCNNCQTLGQFAFDIRLSPNDNDFVFSGSLALYNTLPNPDVPLNLDVSSFTAQTVPTVGNPGTPPLYAGYRTNVLGGGVGEFWAGATVPEPTTLPLLTTGLVVFAAMRHRR